MAIAELFHPDSTIMSRAKSYNFKDCCPKLAAHCDKVNNLPKIKKYLDSRKK